MIRFYRLVILGAAVGWLALNQPACSQNEQGDAIALPGFGLFDADEGTIEFWIKFDFDPLEQHEGYNGRASVLNLSFGDPAFPRDSLSVSIGTKAVPRRTRTGMQCAARVGTVVNGIEIHHPGFPDFGQDAKRDTWYHFAILWGGKTIRYFINGKPVGESELFHSLTPQMSTESLLHIGHVPHKTFSPDRVAMDELRISSIARKPEELGFAVGALRPDANTLLLMNFDSTVSEPKTIEPSFSAIANAAKPQPLPSRYHLIPGRFGKGLALAPDAFKDEK